MLLNFQKVCLFDTFLLGKHLHMKIMSESNPSPVKTDMSSAGRKSVAFVKHQGATSELRWDLPYYL